MTSNEKPQRQQPSILVVEDDENMQLLLRNHLGKAGYKVACVDSGEEALRMVKISNPDLILLDIIMPKMDGYEVCSRFQDSLDTAYIPVVFLSTLDEEPDRIRAFSVGAVDYLAKPVKKKALLDTVTKHINTKNQWFCLSSVGLTDRGGKVLPFDFSDFKYHLASRLSIEHEQLQKLIALSPTELYTEMTDLGLKKSEIARFTADFLNVPYVSQISPDDIILGLLPASFCRMSLVVPVHDTDDDVALILSNPFNLQLQDMLYRSVFTNQSRRYRLRITEPENIVLLFDYNVDAMLDEDTPDDIVIDSSAMSGQVEVAGVDDEESLHSLAASAREASVVRLANTILAKALQKEASDIHVEPRETGIVVRYRIDGVLHELLSIPKKLQVPLTLRFKIMSSLDITQRRIPLDGRARIFFDRRKIDLRVSTLPVHHGEKVVIRILDQDAIALNVEDLGFEKNCLRAVDESLKKPHGLLLVTGPTGSGKTTTMYAALTQLNQPDVNIVTVEDPIEYQLERINQVQIHPEAGLTFPRALRAILRQDPNIIMVGEVRDRETLDIAVKAALTGHLVLSTLHTNDAPSTVMRMTDMGTEPFMVASALEMVASQRLLRKLCPMCKRSAEIPESTLKRFDVPVPVDASFFQPTGCERCGGTGYRGRMAVLEVMTVDTAMRRLIAERASVQTIREHALQQGGMTSLEHNAFMKAARGLTGLEEVFRVVS